MYLPKYLIGRTVAAIVLPEESEILKNIETARDELLRIPLKKKEEINRSEGIDMEDEPSDLEPHPKPDKDGRFNIDLSPRKKEVNHGKE